MKHESLRRRRPIRSPKLRFLIVCEGEVTEPCYFKMLRHLMKSLIELEIRPGGDPKLLVERAVQIKSKSDQLADRRADGFLTYDQVWCVFDVDQHERLSDALQHARDNEIRVAVSNPCFELWALLHFQDQTAHIDRRKLRRLCKKYMPQYDKELPSAILVELRSQAKGRAAQLDQWHENRGTIGANPSTGVYRLVAEIEAAS